MEVVNAAGVAGECDIRERREEITLLRHNTEVCTERNTAAAACSRAIDHRDDGL